MLVGQANVARTSAQPSTPVSPDTSIDGGETFQQRFFALADSMPDWLDRDDVSIHYADLAWRAEFVGVDYSDSEDGLIEARAGIGMAIPPAFMYAADFPALGFTSAQVSRTLVLDAVSDKITLMEGTFELAAMRTGLLESGYTEEVIDGVAVFVFGGDDHIDIAGGAAGRVAISGKTQYAVLLEEGFVGFTNKRAFAEQ